MANLSWSKTFHRRHQTQVSADGFRKGQWKVSKEKEKPLEIDSCMTYATLNKDHDLRLKVVQGKVAAALLAAEEKYKDQLDASKLILKPSRDAIAKQSFRKGQLTLVPATPKIVATDQPVLEKLLSFGVVDSFKIHLMPDFVGPDKDGDYKDRFLPPFWAVRTLRMLTKLMLNSPCDGRYQDQQPGEDHTSEEPQANR